MPIASSWKIAPRSWGSGMLGLEKQPSHPAWSSRNSCFWLSNHLSRCLDWSPFWQLIFAFLLTHEDEGRPSALSTWDWCFSFVCWSHLCHFCGFFSTLWQIASFECSATDAWTLVKSSLLVAPNHPGLKLSRFGYYLARCRVDPSLHLWPSLAVILVMIPRDTPAVRDRNVLALM